MNGRILPSWHAQLRWLQRVDATEEFPAAAIRRAVEASESRRDLGRCELVEDGRHGVDLILNERGGVETVMTVLRGRQ